MASPISFGGLASGLDTTALIQAILRAESRPLDRLLERQTSYNQKKTAFDDLRGKLDALRTRLRDLGERSFRARVGTVSDDTVLRATPGITAATGLYAIDVQALAAAQKNKSDGFVASDQGLISDGTVTLRSGSEEAITIEVSAAAGNNSLRAVRDAINAADKGVEASIIFDGADYRLVVRSAKTGTANALSVTDTTNLSLAAAGNVVATAADARLLVDGIAVTSASNRITDVIPGVTLDLLTETTAGQPVTLEVANDSEGVVSAVKSLVDSYNEIVDFLNTQFDRTKPGPLGSDATARRIQREIQSLFTDGVPGLPDGSIRSLGSVGVSFDGKTGRASLDTSKLEEVLQDNFDGVANLFTASATATDARVSYVAASYRTAAGAYAVTVSQAAEQATVAGSAALAGGVLGRDETLTIAAGGRSVDVALTAGQTIAEVVDTINAALRGAEIGATARDDGGVLRIASREYGSAASVSVASNLADPGDGTGTGFDVVATTDAGVDVAGTIGGVAATGSGQTLTGAAGGGWEGLALRITATAGEIAAAGGDFGTVSYSRGFVRTLSTRLDETTRSTDGTITIAKKSIDDTLRAIAGDIERLQLRLDARERRLVLQFAAAEKAIAALQAQQSQFSGSI